MDQRVVKAQSLFWEIERLRRSDADGAIMSKLREMALLHEERALELLISGDPDGWIDLFAAITAWGEGGFAADAHRLLLKGHELAASFPDGRIPLEEELGEHEHWLALLSMNQGKAWSASVTESPHSSESKNPCKKAGTTTST